MTTPAKDKSVATAAAAMSGEQAAPKKKSARRKFSTGGKWTADDDVLLMRRVRQLVDQVPERQHGWLLTCVQRAVAQRQDERREALVGEANKAIDGYEHPGLGGGMAERKALEAQSLAR